MNTKLLSVIACCLQLSMTASAQDDPTTRRFTATPGQAGWKTVTPSSLGWNPLALARAMDFGMSRNSSSIVIAVGGRIIAEQHRTLSKPSTRYQRMVHGKDESGRVIEDVASVQKSVAGLLVGIAQAKRLLKITDPVHQHLGTGWSNATRSQERRITIRHLLSMSSGLSDRLKFVAAPGTQWKYNTNAYCLSLKCAAAGAALTPDSLTRNWLTEPIGMQHSRWIERNLPDSSPPETNRFGFATTARDLARFGVLILARGRWADATILSDRNYLTDSLNSSQKMNPSYGYLWWLNGQSSAIRSSRKVPGPLNRNAPGDLVAALGALGRKCYVVPSLELVVTRLGDAPDVSGQPGFDMEFWRLLMKAAPAARE